MIVRGFIDGDVQRIALQNEQVKEAGDWSFYDCDETLVFVDGDEVLALVCPIRLEGERIYVASLISQNIGRRMYGFVKILKQMLEEEFRKGFTQRVEFVTQVGFEQAEHLAQILGFEYEGTMRKYFKGLDFKLWGRV